MTTTAIRGGQVYNSDTNSFSRQDVLIDGEYIREIGTDLHGDNVIDADGLYVTPGLIDLHCHVFDHPLFRHSRLNADRIGIDQGVTTLLDTGSAGPTMIDAFRNFVIDTQRTRCFALCNIGSPGQPGIEGGHSAKPELVSLAGTVRAIERNPDWLLGVKVLASSSHTGLLGIEAVRIGRKAAELTGTPLMVHIGNAPPVIDQILDLLRPGDILTHAYHGKVGGVLGYNGKVIDAFREAVARGIIVDIAHGRSSFSYSTCEQALDQGMPVHTISSDLHMGNINRYVVSLVRTMSKFRSLGLSLEDVVKATTLAPASAIGLDQRGFGRLQAGGPAHVSIFSETSGGDRTLEDSEGEVRHASHWIEPRYAIVDGNVYRAGSDI